MISCLPSGKQSAKLYTQGVIQKLIKASQINAFEFGKSVQQVKTTFVIEASVLWNLGCIQPLQGHGEKRHMEKLKREKSKPHINIYI